MTGAVAAATSRIKVGTWVLSALHRNPGITAKAVETIDEISGGRFVLGLGSGHAGRQAHAFGLPEDHVFGRFEEAVEIIVPLLRQGHADFEGTFHAARDLEHRPVGPRPGRIPIMMGAEGPEDAPAGGPPRRHLELVRRGAERPHGVRAAPGHDAGGLRSGRAGPRHDRPVGGHRRRAHGGHGRGRGPGCARQRHAPRRSPTPSGPSEGPATRRSSCSCGRPRSRRSRRWRRSSSSWTATESGSCGPPNAGPGAILRGSHGAP